MEQILGSTLSLILKDNKTVPQSPFGILPRDKPVPKAVCPSTETPEEDPFLYHLAWL